MRGDVRVPGGDNAVNSSLRVSLLNLTPSSTACLPPTTQTTNKHKRKSRAARGKSPHSPEFGVGYANAN